MRVTLRGLRGLMVAGAVALLLLLVSFLGVAHFRAHRLLRGLPGRLGADVEKETNDFTYSQAVKGRTVFTLHAAKAVQHRDGLVLLHDVGIVLYGPEQTRADRIYGKDFEYDQKHGVVRAAGEVHLDLSAPVPADPAGRTAYAAGRETAGRREATDPEMVHVKTSGLVYVQSLGMASTAEEVEFSYRGISGRAHGAAFDSATGATTLEQAVELRGVRNGRPMELRADHAELMRASGQAMVRGAQIETVDARGEREQGSAGLMQVVLRHDGTAKSAAASGGVSLMGKRGRVEAPRGAAEMDEQGRPTRAELLGGLHYTGQRGQQQVSGEAAEGVAALDAKGQVHAVHLTGGVAFQERTGQRGEAGWSERELHGARLELTLGRQGAARRGVEEAVAEGGARLLLRAAGIDGSGLEQSEVRGDRLVAHFNAGAQLTRAEGTGHTGLEQRRAGGTVARSTAETLAIQFTPRMATAAVAGREDRATAAGMGRVLIAEATERGAVRFRQEGSVRRGEQPVIEGGAQEAQYHGSRDELVLLGGATLSEGVSRVQADRIELERRSGDGRAQGHVEVSAVRAGAAEVTHVVAGEATFVRSTDVATFRGAGAGAGGGDARAWQGGSQVEAPTLVLDGQERVFEAQGTAGTESVRTVLSEGQSGGARQGRGDTVRVTSGRLRYSDAARTAEFRGGVLLQDANGSLRSAEATAVLRASAPAAQVAPAGATAAKGTAAAGSGAALLPTGALERVIARGGVVLRQPGREGTGEQVVYTAADGMFTLTGSAAAPPRVVDATNGMVQGASIRFHSGDNAVVISGEPGRGSAGRVRTETRVKND